jgi:predicted transcriptional regulator
MNSFSERLALAIKVSGMRHMDFVLKSGISATHFSHIVNGHREPNFENLATIVRSLPGVDARWLICGERP